MSAAIAYERKHLANVRASLATGEEPTLLAFARGGNSAAFESLVELPRDALFSITQRILFDREDAGDVAQNACFPQSGRVPGTLAFS